jgi:cytochrome c oxidase subunit 3
MSEIKNHPFHLVNPSPWPLFASFSAFLFAIGMVAYMHNWEAGFLRLLVGIAFLLAGAFFWWSDVISEGKYDRAHTPEVQHGLKKGMIFFIISEGFFFATFFAAFFYLWINPVKIFEDIWIFKPGKWIPDGITPLSAWDLPLLNTIILLLSGTTATWAHYAIKKNKIRDVTTALLCTIFLGILFSLIQAYEYHHAGFGLKAEGYQAFYTTIFYMCTGFHGLHVILGTIFLIVCLIRNIRGSLSSENHLSLEFAAWYWHFVDAVWIFLFIFLYWLGGK